MQNNISQESTEPQVQTKIELAQQPDIKLAEQQPLLVKENKLDTQLNVVNQIQTHQSENQDKIIPEQNIPEKKDDQNDINKKDEKDTLKDFPSQKSVEEIKNNDQKQIELEFQQKQQYQQLQSQKLQESLQLQLQKDQNEQNAQNELKSANVSCEAGRETVTELKHDQDKQNQPLIVKQENIQEQNNQEQQYKNQEIEKNEVDGKDKDKVLEENKDKEQIENEGTQKQENSHKEYGENKNNVIEENKDKDQIENEETDQQENNNKEQGDNKDKDQEEQRQKQKRRTRNDPVDRNFTCGCGKSYLSYPALYTHLKTKHDGKAPDGTTMPKVENKGNKGRPRRECQDKESSDEELDKAQINNQENINILNELSQFLVTIHQEYKAEDNSEVIDLEKNFPTNLFRKTEEYSVILQNLNQTLTIKENIEESKIEKPNQDKNSSSILNDLFQKYIVYISKSVNQTVLKEYLILLLLYRRALNQYGWELLQKSKSDKEYCAENQGEGCLLLINDFIVEILPQYFKEIKQFDCLQIIGNTDEKLKNVVYLMQFFANWLFVNKFTNNKLVMMPSDEQ